jgi:hypothetical protein
MSLVETLKKSKATIIINDTSNANSSSSSSSSSSSNKFAQNQLKKYGWKEGDYSILLLLFRQLKPSLNSQ